MEQNIQLPIQVITPGVTLPLGVTLSDCGVHISGGVCVETPILLENVAQTDILLEQGASATIIICHTGQKSHSRKCTLLKNSKLEIIEYLASVDTSVEIECEQDQNADSQFDAVIVAKGNKLSEINYNINLSDKKASATINCLYLTGEDQKTKIKINMNHNSAECTSNQLIKGLASSNGRGIFEGKIFVAQKAQQTEAVQQSRNILLSDNARITTMPQLEIYADDVKCAHGATVGQMNDDAIYYMRQRGINETDARKLQLSGFVNDVLSNIQNESLAEYFYNHVEHSIELL